jgi:16S rRNA (cytosine967-C5)-methyltransferase
MPPPAISQDLEARRTAVLQLLRVEDEGAYTARLAVGDRDDASGTVARRASHWVAGVTRHRRWLDFLVASFYRGDLDAMQGELRQILRLGVYDLVERGVPPHAAVSETVETARQMLHKGAAGLTNGVLRALVRAMPGLPEPGGDPAEALAVRHSHPTWMVRRWLDRLGVDATVAFLRGNNASPVYGVRANLRRLDRDALLAAIAEAGGDADPSPWLDDLVRTQRMQPILRAGLLADGRCAVQDEAAALVVRVLDPQPGERVLDAAAAPGGKALYAAQRMDDTGALVALDVSEPKLGLLRKAARAQGATTIAPVRADLRTWTADAPFDRVLLDAPCSGTGVLAKRADLRWRREEADLSELTALQDRLLDAAAAHVRPGGLLVYATCSVEPEENEERVAAFVARAPAFAVETAAPFVPAAMLHADGNAYQALPWAHRTDGAFAVRLRRQAA